MASIKPGDNPLSFDMNGTTLKPINRVLDRRFSVYFKAI
jgi:hypothetical protein